MCRLILKADLPDRGVTVEGPDDVIEVLPDFEHPGTEIMTGDWNSRPKPGWQVIDLPGVPVDRIRAFWMEEAQEEDRNGALQTVNFRVRRLDRTQLDGFLRSELASNGWISAEETDLKVRTTVPSVRGTRSR